jgi:phasin family protein
MRENAPLSSESETKIAREHAMDGLSGTTIDPIKTFTTMTKTTEEFTSFSKGNIEAMMKSGKVWTDGCQEISKTIAATAKARFESSMSNWKALMAVKSLKEAIDLQTSLTRTSVETALAETGKITDASIKLTEQALAPITERVSLAIEKLTKPPEAG